MTDAHEDLSSATGAPDASGVADRPHHHARDGGHHGQHEGAQRAHTSDTGHQAQHENTQRGNKWWTLVAVCFGTFMLLLDITIVNVALPDIQRALHSSFSDLQWVVDAYALTLAAFLLTAGSLADMYGRRLMYLARPGRFHGRVRAVRFRPDHADAATVPRPAGRRRRDHVRGIAGAARRRLPR